MNLKQKLGQRLMIGIRGTSLDDETKAHLRKISPGGVILFSRNIRNYSQVCKLIRDIKATVQPPPLIAIDQEGGLVVRFFLREITLMPGNMALGATNKPELAYKQGRFMARELKSMGIDINLAPVVDVATNPDNPGITIRSFGEDPEKVAELGVNFIKGTQSEGIGAVAKHFPGKGAAGKDAHFDLPTINLSQKEMNRVHLYPFWKCIENGVQGIMSTHAIYTNLPGGEKVPATFASKLIKGYLRREMNFQGVIFSDDLEMGAITKYFPFNEAVVNTIRAGHDMLLICSDYEKQLLALKVLEEICKVNDTVLAETERAIERIEKLRSFSQGENKTLEGLTKAIKNRAANLATQIAESAITVYKGKAPIPVPISKTKKIFVIIPDLSQLESVEEGFEVSENNFIRRTLEAKFPLSIQTEFISLDPKENEIEKVWQKVEKADLTLFFVFNARFIEGERMLLKRLKAHPQKVIFLLIRNPFDLELIGPDLTSLITYGYRKVQIEAVIKVLSGDIPALGKLPFTPKFSSSLERKGFN